MRPPTEPTTFFIDRSLGTHDVADALRAAGAAEKEDGVVEQDGQDKHFEHAAHSGEGDLPKQVRPRAVHGGNLPRGAGGRKRQSGAAVAERGKAG